MKTQSQAPRETARERSLRGVMLRVAAALLVATVVCASFLALADTHQVTRDDESLLSTLNESGLRLLEVGEPGLALSLFDEMCKRSPNDVVAQVNRSLALVRIGRYAEARLAAERALRTDPNCVEALNNRAEALAGVGELDLGLKTIGQALALDAKRVNVWVNKANILAAKGKERWADASAAYDYALSLRPDYPEALVGKGWLAFHSVENAQDIPERREYEDVLQLAKRAVDHHPRSPYGWHLLIRVHLRRRDDEAAASLLEKAMQWHPKDSGVWCDKGVLLNNLGDYSSSLEALKTSVGLDPSNYRAWDRMAEVLHALGRSSEAVEKVNKALDINPGYAPALRQAVLLQRSQSEPQSE